MMTTEELPLESVEESGNVKTLDDLAAVITDEDVGEIEALGLELNTNVAKTQLENLNDGIRNFEENLKIVEEGAKEGLEKLNNQSTDLTESDLKSKAKFELVLKNVEAIRTQEGLLEYLRNEKSLQAFMAYDLNYLDREYKKIKGFFRTIQFDETNFKATIANAHKFKREAFVRRNTATLYCVLRYLVHLKTIKQLRSNIIYMNFTLGAIAAVLLKADTKFFTTEEVHKILNSKTIV